MSSDPGVRPLRLPPANLNEIKVSPTRQSARNWFRVHQSRFQTIHFSVNSAHRFSHEECPHSLLYLAADGATGLFERFGDKMYDQQHAIAQSLWDAHCISMVRVPELRIWDLTRAKTLSALRVDLSSLMHHDLSSPQRWGLAIQEHPANFGAIKYKSRFNGKACLALIRRAEIEARLRPRILGRLSRNDAAADWLDRRRVVLY